MMDAATVILALCGVLLGDGGSDKGLMSHIVNGRQHIERCQIGMWITPGLRGDPCSARCQRAHEAIALAAEFLRAHEAPAQMPLLEIV